MTTSLDHNFLIYKIRRLNGMNSVICQSQKDQGFVFVSDNKSNKDSHYKIIRTIQKSIKKKVKFFKIPTIWN